LTPAPAENFNFLPLPAPAGVRAAIFFKQISNFLGDVLPPRPPAPAGNFDRPPRPREISIFGPRARGKFQFLAPAPARARVKIFIFGPRTRGKSAGFFNTACDRFLDRNG